MIKLGMIMFVIIIFLFYILAYMGVGLKGILIAYFSLLGITSFFLVCLLKSKATPKERDENE